MRGKTILNPLLFLIAAAAAGEDWTRFRGPNGSGISTSTGFPSELGKDKNVVWRTPVRPGKSSPILTERHVFVTAFEEGKLFTQCFDRKTGKLLWERGEQRPREEMANTLNHPAAITPVTDGENVYSFFKDYGMISYNSNGTLRWKAPLGPFTNTMGLGASPIVSGDSIVVLADQLEGKSFIAAIDRKNGELRWKTSREESEGWGTPLIHQSAGSSPVIVTASRGQLGAYLPGSGKRIVNLHEIATTIVASPILHDGTLYVFGYGSETPAPFETRLKRSDKNQDGKLTADEYGTDAFVRGIATYVGNRDGVVTQDEWDLKQREVLGPNRLIAFRLEPGDASAPVRVRELWRHDKNFTGVIPSPLLYDGVLYVLRNGGILTSYDAKTGEVIKTGRITGALGGYSASPVAAEGKLFIASEDGHLAVVKSGGDWEVLSVNELGEDAFATPALSGGQVFVRTSEALYCFGMKK